MEATHTVKSALVTICCALDRVFIPSRSRKNFSGATNSSDFDLRALNSDVKWTFIVSCKLVKQTIHWAFLSFGSVPKPLFFCLRVKKGRKLQSQQACSSRKWIVYLSHTHNYALYTPVYETHPLHWKFISVEKHEGKIITQHIRFYLWMKHYHMARKAMREEEFKSAFYGNS